MTDRTKIRGATKEGDSLSLVATSSTHRVANKPSRGATKTFATFLGTVFAFSSLNAMAATINVPADYGTIQAAITAASPNDTIEVAAGTYNEHISIDKALTLRGAQADKDPVEGGRTGGETKITNPYPVQINASGVTFNGFEVADFRYGVNIPASAFVAPDYTIQNVVIAYNWIHASDAWVGFNAEPGLLKNLMITHNFIDVDNVTSGGDPYALAAIGFSEGATATPTYENVEISYNRIRNLSADGAYGLFAGASPSTYLINTCSIKGNLFQNIADGSNMNIGNIYDGELSDNVFETSPGTIGIDTGLISGNTLRYGARLGLWGTDYGFTRPSTNVIITNNDFTDEVNGRGLTIGNGALADTMEVHLNAFRNSGIAGDLIRNLGTGTLNATDNWWGSSSGPSGNTGSLNGAITSSPWMTSYTDDPLKLVAPTTWPLSVDETRLPGFWPLSAEVVRGTGKYLPNGTNVASFHTFARLRYDQLKKLYYVSGQLRWMMYEKYRLLSSSLTSLGYTTIAGYQTCSLVKGTGKLATWNATKKKWTNETSVNFVATACDGGVEVVDGKRRQKPDAFGIDILNKTIVGESAPTVLTHGKVQLN